MKFLIVLAALATAIVAKSIAPIEPNLNTAYGYLMNIGVPRAEAIRKAEDEYHRGESRIFGGRPAFLGQFPYQAGLLTNLMGGSTNAVCGGSLVSSSRVLTAAHCWFDGFHQGTRITVVLGSILVFSGGTRLDSNNVVAHPNWTPHLVANDIAIIRLPRSVASNTISPIALPSGSQLNEQFSGAQAVVSGFGLTSASGGISSNQFLSFVNVNVISNSECSSIIGPLIQSSNVCTRGPGNVGACSSDSGGPLAITRNNRPLLIGVVSFGTSHCGPGLTNGYARVTSYISFINQNL